MLSPDDFQYALENTRVILAPARRVDTFGTSIFNYFLVTEAMDTANLSRVREGHIHAERPQILTPQNMAKLMLDGFGEEGATLRRADQRSGRALRISQVRFSSQQIGYPRLRRA